MTGFVFCTQADEQKEESPATKSIVGIIYPPPEVRNIVDKTASFVARYGPQHRVQNDPIIIL